MKNLSLGFSIVSIVVLVAAVLAKGSTEAELTKQAKITKVQAQEIVLAKVSHGVAKKRGDRKGKGTPGLVIRHCPAKDEGYHRNSG